TETQVEPVELDGLERRRVEHEQDHHCDDAGQRQRDGVDQPLLEGAALDAVAAFEQRLHCEAMLPRAWRALQRRAASRRSERATTCLDTRITVTRREISRAAGLLPIADTDVSDPFHDGSVDEKSRTGGHVAHPEDHAVEGRRRSRRPPSSCRYAYWHLPDC